MLRHGESLKSIKNDKQVSGLNDKQYLLNSPIIEISGTDIRARVTHGKHYRYLVPDKVYEYILENRIYII